MNCKRCQAQMEENTRFCPVCGAVQPLVCPACGAESRPGSRTCSGCGKKLPRPVREEAPKARPSRRRRTGVVLLSIGICLVAVTLLVGALQYLGRTLRGVDAPAANSGETDEQEQQILQQPEETPDKTPETIPMEVIQPEQEEQPEEENPEEENPEEEQPEEAPEDPQWIFPDSDTRLLTQADLAGLSDWELKVARNEIYARHGRRFTSARLQAHFDSCSWYEGTVDADQFDETVFNDVERANIALLYAAAEGQ